jgi:hypothetical protein
MNNHRFTENGANGLQKITNFPKCSLVVSDFNLITYISLWVF